MAALPLPVPLPLTATFRQNKARRTGTPIRKAEESVAKTVAAEAEPVKMSVPPPVPSPPAWNDVIARNPELLRAQILSVQSTLHLATIPSVLSGRSKEMKLLHDFIDSALTKCQGSSLYLCGSPGTGKTASVDHVMKHFVANTTSQLLNSFSPSPSLDTHNAPADTTSNSPDTVKPASRKRGRPAASTPSLAASDTAESKSDRAPFEYIYINAMTLADPKALYTELFDRLSHSAAYGDACDAARNACEDDGDFRMSPLAAADMVQTVFCSKSKKRRMCVLVIDEIDSLLSRNQSVLYRIFELPLKVPSSLVLVGIANSMDLTEQFLPRLRQRGCEPQLVVVPPYDQHQLLSIIRNRLSQASAAATQAVQTLLSPPSKPAGRGRARSLQSKRRKSAVASRAAESKLEDDMLPSEPCEVNALDLFESDALELCCRKVASASGDVRKVLDVCRQSLDRLLPCPEVPPCHQVTRTAMSQVLGAAFGSPVVGRIQQLPTHQQIVLCIASLLFRNNSKDVTLAKFFATYSRLAQLIVLPSVSAGDFVDLFTALDSLGFLTVAATGKTSIKGGKARSKDASDWHKQRIAMSVQSSDIEFALADNSFFVELLKRAECDNRVQQLLRN